MKTLKLIVSCVFLAAVSTTASAVELGGGKNGLSTKSKYYGHGKVLSVAKEGLIVMNKAGTVVLVTNHPKHKAGTAADGDIVYSWVAPQKKTYVYNTAGGARKTVKIYKHLAYKKPSKVKKSGEKRVF